MPDLYDISGTYRYPGAFTCTRGYHPSIAGSLLISPMISIITSISVSDLLRHPFLAIFLEVAWISAMIAFNIILLVLTSLLAMALVMLHAGQVILMRAMHYLPNANHARFSMSSPCTDRIFTVKNRASSFLNARCPFFSSSNVRYLSFMHRTRFFRREKCDMLFTCNLFARHSFNIALSIFLLNFTRKNDSRLRV